LKRVPIATAEFLREVVAPLPLRPEERRLLERCLEPIPTADQPRLFRELMESLVARGVWEPLGRELQSGGGELWRLRDPERRVRMQVRVSLEAESEAPVRFAMASDGLASPTLLPQQVQQLLALQGQLLIHDRLLAPRDLIARVEQLIGDLAPGATATFLPLEMPGGDDRTAIPWSSVPVEKAELERLARDLDHGLYWRRDERRGSLALLPVGDETQGWRGVFAVRHPAQDAFPSDQIERLLLPAQLFRSLLGATLRLQGLVFYDVLTGIHNRAYFEEQFERELSLARRREQSMALLIADIDDFKAFNTKFGYEGGDRVLATVACVLKATLRVTDTLARYGGEEFAILLAPHVPRDEAERIAERLRAAVADEPLLLPTLGDGGGNPAPQRVTVAIGGAMHPDDGRSARELWNVANRRLLAAKAAGKNRALLSDA